MNALGHWRGAGNFENSASNWRLLAWITAGESRHNNHHAHPRSPRFRMRKWEFEASWPIIRSPAAAGLLLILGSPIVSTAATSHQRNPS